MILRGRGDSTIWGRYTRAFAFDSAGELLDVGDDAAVPLGDVPAELARVKLRLVSHGVVSRFRVGV